MTLTPVVDSSGDNQVQQVESCSVMAAASTASSASSPAAVTSTGAASLVPFPTIVTSGGPTFAPTTTVSVLPSSSIAAASGTGVPAIAVNVSHSFPDDKRIVTC